jgi:hypothetical protein
MKKLNCLNSSYKAVYLFMLMLVMNTSYAQKLKEIPTVRILFVFDCSLSMIGKWETANKMDVSKSILIQTVDSLK